MLNAEIFGKLGNLKDNMQNLLGKLSDKRLMGRKKGEVVSPDDIDIENYQYESHRIDDLPLTIIKDPGPGIKYNYTENSEFAKGAEKAAAVGIDSFGEKDSIDPDEADDHQDYRNRNQNSDLNSRFFTRGLDTTNKDLQH